MNKKIIAVTGGIGSGKSSVIKILKEMGYGTISCDAISNKLLSSHIIKDEIKKYFPDCVSGKLKLRLNKKKLTEQVFSSTNKRRQLEDILHPIVLKTAIKMAKKGEISFVEVPILFERGYERMFDGVIVVLRDRQKRIEGVKIRSNILEKEIVDRISNQIDYDNEKFDKYYVIDNNKDIINLKKEINKIINLLKK